MKNKKLLYIGLGVVALVGLYFIFRPSGDTTTTDTTEGKSNPPSGSGDSEGSSTGGTEMGGEGMTTLPSSSPSVKDRRQNRRNCNAEARKIYRVIPRNRKDREAKQKYKIDCYKNGGFDDGSGE